MFYLVGYTEFQNSPESWLISANLQDVDDSGELYIVSVYFALTTMATIGYGDLSPKTRNERVVGIVSLIASCGVFSYLVGAVQSIVDGSDSIISEFK